ncbi:ATP-grasp domain-containing protein [bacterium]|nr:ATP-grasp domain-containing protein [bacterium]
MDGFTSIGLVGASCRAMAASLRRTHGEIAVADMFADFDTRQLAQVTQLKHYPWSARDWLRRGNVNAWCYTGGIENYPRLIARLAEEKTLLGNGPEVLRKVRDPFWLRQVAANVQLAFPVTAKIGEVSPVDFQRSDWLLKPFRSAGGLRVADAARPIKSRRFYWQQKVAGQPMSVAVLSTRNRWQVIGLAELQVGPSYGAPGKYIFAGAVTSEMEIDPELMKWIDVIHHQAKMIGLWGIDFIQTDRPTLLEVNPRWTATMPLYDRCIEKGLMNAHVRACLNEDVSIKRQPNSTATAMNRILYADQEVQFTDEMLRQVLSALDLSPKNPLPLPATADLPMPGTRIELGHPVCTLYAADKDQESAEQTLHQNIAKVQCIVFGDEISEGRNL